MDVKRIQSNLSNNMLVYSIVAILLGLFCGKIFPQLKILSKVITYIVIGMIYPMMINVSTEHLRRIKGSLKPLLVAMFLNFIYSPIVIYLLSDIFISDPHIKLALMLLSIAPSSSMGLGYLGIAEGHILTGAIIVAFAFISSIFIYPTLGSWFAGQAHIVIPQGIILKNLFWILILPLFCGILTREYIERKHEVGTFNKVKPYLSIITLSLLYILMFSIFAAKARLIISEWKEILRIAPVLLIYYPLTLGLFLHINKKIFKLEYGHHQAVVFTSISKNVALTIAILIAIFGERGIYMSTVPAIVAIFQAPILMIYLHFKDYVKKFFG